jgi:hypothetical protein
MLRREKRNDVIARDARAEIDDEVPEILLLVRADGAVSEKHERSATDQTTHGMVRVDPGINPGASVELSARRTKFN